MLVASTSRINGTLRFVRYRRPHFGLLNLTEVEPGRYRSRFCISRPTAGLLN